MLIEKNVPLQAFNTFGIAARADTLVRVRSQQDLSDFAASAHWRSRCALVLGGGSNIVLAGDVAHAVVLKMEVPGIELVGQTEREWIVQAGAGVLWHDLVRWTLAHGMAGLENLALIPGTVGAAPVQNIGAYGLELQDRFESLDALDLHTGQLLRLEAAHCGFGYRDSVFKHPAPEGGDAQRALGMGLAGRAVVLTVRVALPKRYVPQLDYADLQKMVQETGITQPSAAQVFDWVCNIRRSKLPDPAVLGNAGSFFKNPVVSAEQCRDIIAREPGIVYYQLHDGRFKLAAGWLIDACGWKGKRMGAAGVHTRQALVLVNRATELGAGHTLTGGEVMTLARAIQTSVYERFGIWLEPEPVLAGGPWHKPHVGNWLAGA